MLGREECRARDIHFLSGGGRGLGNGWVRFEDDERELGARAAHGLDNEAVYPGGWLTDVMYAAECAGMTPEELLTRDGQQRLREAEAAEAQARGN